MKIIGFKWYERSFVCKHTWKINQNDYTNILMTEYKNEKKRVKSKKKCGILVYCIANSQQIATITRISK